MRGSSQTPKNTHLLSFSHHVRPKTVASSSFTLFFQPPLLLLTTTNRHISSKMPRISPFKPLLRLPLLPPTATPILRTTPSLLCSTPPQGLMTASRSPILTYTFAAPGLSLSPSLSALPSLYGSPSPSAPASLGQVRTVTYGSEYQPSQRIRKRRHGFLARIKTRNGRKTIMRRKFRGKAKLSH